MNRMKVFGWDDNENSLNQAAREAIVFMYVLSVEYIAIGLCYND